MVKVLDWKCYRKVNKTRMGLPKHEKIYRRDNLASTLNMAKYVLHIFARFWNENRK